LKKMFEMMYQSGRNYVFNSGKFENRDEYRILLEKTAPYAVPAKNSLQQRKGCHARFDKG
jgi:hypothetical protein